MLSTIIPTYNGAAFLAQAVASIRANSFEPSEIIVVDDGSTDATVTTAKALGVRVIKQAHSGRPAVTRNEGIRAAQGDFIAFCDQDDLWTPDKVARQMQCFDADAALQVVWGKTQRMELSAQGQFKNTGAPLDYRLVSAGLFRRRVFERVGLFDESLRYFGDDTDWFLRARELNVPMKMMDEVTLFWRIHANNASHANIRNHAQGVDHALTEVLHKALARRREREANR